MAAEKSRKEAILEETDAFMSRQHQQNEP